MASFYEASDPKPQSVKPNFLPAITTGNGGHVPDDESNTDETPIFSKRKMTLRIPERFANKNFLHLTICKNWLVCILATDQTTLLRFFLPRALPPGEIALEKYLAGYKISNIFLDHTGFHLLISLVPKSPGLLADFLYIHGNGPKVRRIEKFKDHEITAVAFNKYAGTEASTGAILLGTSRGLIFETELLQDADKPSYRKQVYDLGLGRTKYPITGLELLCIPNTSKYIVIATAPDCIFTFEDMLQPDEKSLQNIFASYVGGTKQHGAKVVETDLTYSVLRLYTPPNEKFPQKWGWLCGTGICAGQISTYTSSSPSNFLLIDESSISLDFKQHKLLSYEERRLNVPKSFVLTQYHALLLYPDHITAICLLNQEIVYEEYFHEHMGKLLNIVRDYFTGVIYVYTEKMLFNFVVSREQRNIWKIYLSKGLYEEAEICTANPEQMDIVLASKAEAAIEENRYEEAAIIYSKTEKPFEEICLKFIELEDKRPIIVYVKNRLQKLDKSNGDDSEQIKVLIIWLIELYLTEINMPGRASDERLKWQQEYDLYMRDEPIARFCHENHNIIRKVIAQHADGYNLSQFAIANGDYEEVINQHLNASNYNEALLTLRKQKNIELYYKYCPLLIEQLPHETVEVLMALGSKLDIEKLIPTLITLDSRKHIEEIIKYLEFVIYKLGETNQAVHNFLLRLYAQHKPAKVISYLTYEGEDESLLHYDINYALSVCMEFDAKIACVFLQRLLRMWSIAVDLALTFNIELAKETARKPKDEEVSRKLWLRIAEHDIKGTNDVKKALELLKECELLRIEDLLPFFSDFEKIDDFKQPICSALKDYNQKIQELQHDMHEYTKQAERVRNDLQNVRDRRIRIQAQEPCAICDAFLLFKPFFVFACGHKFHSDCLEKQVIPMLSSDKSRKLTMLKQQLESMITQSIAMADKLQAQQKNREKIKMEIEEILASDCLYCGLMIETIDQPFVEDWDQVNVDWE